MFRIAVLIRWKYTRPCYQCSFLQRWPTDSFTTSAESCYTMQKRETFSQVDKHLDRYATMYSTGSQL